MAEAGCEARQAAQLPSLACSLHDTHTPHSESRKEDPTRAEAIGEIMPGLKGSARPDDFHRYRDLPIFQEKPEIQIFMESFWILNCFPFVLTLCSPNKVHGQTACGPGPATCRPRSQGSCLLGPCPFLLAQGPGEF